MHAVEEDVANRLEHFKDREKQFAKDQQDLMVRLKKIEAQELRLPSLMDREKQLVEHERLVEMRNREMNHRSQKLEDQRESLKKLEATSEARVKMLDERYHSMIVFL